MAFFTWNETYSVSHDDFDRQHKRLIDMINELYDAMKQGKGNEALSKLIIGLKGYTVTHFTNEERELAKINYPDLAEQISQHEAFVKKVTEFQNRLSAGKEGLSVEMMNFLKDWLTKHIMGADKKYASFFSKVPVK
jgi:hemerythrin